MAVITKASISKKHEYLSKVYEDIQEKGVSISDNKKNKSKANLKISEDKLSLSKQDWLKMFVILFLVYFVAVIGYLIPKVFI